MSFDNYTNRNVKSEGHPYPHVRAALDRCKLFVEQLSQREAVAPASPNGYPPVNMMEFKLIADAMQQLPTVKTPQLLSPELIQSIRDLQKEYIVLIREAGRKLNLSAKDMDGIVRAVMPNVNLVTSRQESAVSKANFAFAHHPQKMDAKKADANKPKPSLFGGLFKRQRQEQDAADVVGVKRAGLGV